MPTTIATGHVRLRTSPDGGWLFLVIISVLLLVDLDASAVEDFSTVTEERVPANRYGYVQAEVHPSRVVLLLDDDVTLRPKDSARNGVALGHLDGFADIAARMNVTRLRPVFPKRDRGEKWEFLNRYFVVEFDGPTPEEVVQAYTASRDVAKASCDPVGGPAARPNDPYLDVKWGGIEEYPHQWYLLEAPGIDAPRAWDFVVGDPSVLVGMVDSGVNYAHIELGGENYPTPDNPTTDGAIWVNTNEIPGNAIDDDGNGYVDDVIGYDFWEEHNNPIDEYSDSYGHGTKCTGVIAALANNGKSISGLLGGTGDGTQNWNRLPGVKVVPCAVGHEETTPGLLSVYSEALVYLADLKADGWNVAAVNASWYFWGWGWDYSIGNAAVAYLVDQDVLLVAGAGNDDISTAYWPCNNPAVLAVGATDSLATPADFSNFGSWVDVAAPGVDIYTTGVDASDPYHTTRMAYTSGTSLATPLVTGIAAMLKTYDPTLTRQQLWDLIVQNTTPYVPTKDVGSGIANAWLALSAILDDVLVEHEPLPYRVAPHQAQSTQAWVESIGGGAIPAGGVEVFYRVDGGVFVPTTLDPTGEPDSFSGFIPAQPLGSRIDYYIRAENDEGQVAFSPPGAPVQFHTYRVDDDFSDDFEDPSGWYIGSTDEGDGAPGWEWADPDGTEIDGIVVQPEDDHTVSGTHCWVTGAPAGTDAGSYEVDGGATVLYSPRFDLRGATEVEFSYWYHFVNIAEIDPWPGYNPSLIVEFSNDDGETWTVLQQLFESSGGWQQYAAGLDTLVATPDILQLRFTATDHLNTSILDALIDDFHLVGIFGTVGVEDDLDIVIQTSLAQNSPNPFNPRTTIRFSLAQPGPASLCIYDVRGQLICELADGHFDAGTVSLVWDGRDQDQALVGSGTYFYRLVTEERTVSRKMLLVR